MARIVLLSFFSFLTLSSCQFFEKKTPNKDVLLQEELKKIDWKKVDAMPSTSYCDSIEDKKLCEACFFDYIKLNLYKRITNDTIQKNYPNLDTIKVRVTVFPDGDLKFKPIFSTGNLQEYNTTSVDSLLQTKLINFPKVEPAIKRGIKIKSEFEVPIILK
ncbi:MAG: hypothetical protein QM535_02295 [Limnohabitans sp.]|nr:hypothetical protein [Limnohabitans sp.]